MSRKYLIGYFETMFPWWVQKGIEYEYINSENMIIHVRRQNKITKKCNDTKLWFTFKNPSDWHLRTVKEGDEISC